MIGQIVDAQKSRPVLAEVLNREAEHRVENKHGIHLLARVTVRDSELPIIIERIKMKGERREERIVALVYRAAPVMDEFATDLEILVPMATLTLHRSLPKFEFHPLFLTAAREPVAK